MLLEWSTPGNSIVTAFDIIMGNYIFVQIEEALEEDDMLGYAIASDCQPLEPWPGALRGDAIRSGGP